ncbi:transglutaminase-like domain-containing protein [Propionibacteriaceae bacterium Y2011]
MSRDVSATFEASLSGRCNIIWSVATAVGVPVGDEQLEILVDDRPVEFTEMVDRHGSRLHQLVADGSRIELRYRASGIGTAELAPVDPTDLITYLRPSRYCESDRLGPTAWNDFAGLSGGALLDAVSDRVHEKLSYVAGSSKGTDGAVDTLLNRKGVCRDFSHLTIALLRAMNVPARLVSCYAPGLSPMEFHAVVEAYVDDNWVLVDSTRKAPRASLVRIATGRDAADTAFITNHWARLDLERFTVTAVADELPHDEHRERIRMR